MNPELPDFFAWHGAQSAGWRERPWLVLGKGPSLERLEQFDIGGFNTFGLNHVVKHIRVDIAHAIDLDVVTDCGSRLLENCGHVLMPWFPHINHRPGRIPLSQVAQEVPVLREAAAQGRLLWYNKTGSPGHGDSPTIRVMRFSAEVPYGLLGMVGVRKIRSLGIDGGQAYASGFDPQTLLANGRDSFDSQFDQIARSIMEHGLDAAPIGIDSPARVYVAATEEQMLAARVLEYSIHKHASMTTKVIHLHRAGIAIPQPLDRANQPRTPFSFQRFLIPEVAGRCGRAIYLDSDMQVMADIRGLWEQDLGDNQLLSASAGGGHRKPQYSVMLLDCAALPWQIGRIVSALDAGEFTYEDLMQRMVIAPRQAAAIASEWNSLEAFDPVQTRLIHYTDMNTQPWVYARHPLGHIWAGDLIEAVEGGYISEEDIREHVRNGWVRPSLEYQVEHRIADPFALPRSALAADGDFSPPYHKLRAQPARPLYGAARYLRVLMKDAIRSPRLDGLRRIKRRWWH